MILPVSCGRAVEELFRLLTLVGVQVVSQPGCGQTLEHQCLDRDRLQAKLPPPAPANGPGSAVNLQTTARDEHALQVEHTQGRNCRV